ncbi:MAG: PTS sugar transporter subunit IIC [Smithella sp.]|jgi:PTS system mannose-specific IIC component
MVFKVMLISFVGSLLCLDRVFMQTMICRPVIIAPVIGIILGNPYAGLIIGAILELFWMERIPIGIYIPPNDSIAAVLAASTAILAGQALGSVSKELTALSILLAIPFGIIAKRMDVKIVESNNLLSDQALEAAKRLDIRAIERATCLGMAKLFAFYIVVLVTLQFILIYLTILIYPRLSSEIKAMLSMTYYFLPLLGIAVAINTIKLRGAIPVFCGIFLVVAVALEFFHVI